MSIKIYPPKLLENGSLNTINDKMMRNNHTFVFLGPNEIFLNRSPLSWIEAFEMYITGLYKVYHEYGMEFLRCYCYEAIGHDDNWSLIRHIQFVQNCRGALQHSSDGQGCRERAFNTIKKYVFSRDSYFTFRDWSDFWEHAKDNHWQRVTEVIVRDSNKLMTFLESITPSNTTCKSIGDSVFEDFINRKFSTYRITERRTVSTGNYVDMYEKSFDKRFFSVVSSTLTKLPAFRGCEEKVIAELKRLIHNESKKDDRSPIEKSEGVKTLQEIKTAIFDIVINDLKSSDESVPWNPIFDYILSIIEEQIKNQLTAKTRAEMMETLDL